MSDARLFSDKPEDLAALADETIEYLKAQIAAFDAKQQPIYERLRAYAAEAVEDDRPERYEALSRRAAEFFADWRYAREPMLKELQWIAMAKDGLTPRTVTFAWTEKLCEGLAHV